MKLVLIFSFLLMGWFSPTASKAQISLGLSFNIGTQPVWGPVGYDYAEYYYMPDIDVYYNVSQRQYIYLQSGRWRFSSSLPYRARNYNIYSGHKVVINESRPYLNNQVYKVKYANYRGDHSQPIIRDSRDRKYFEAKEHPQHHEWKHQEQNEGNGKKGKHNNGHGNNKEKD